jgi:hypothetical protein
MMRKLKIALVSTLLVSMMSTHAVHAAPAEQKPIKKQEKLVLCPKDGIIFDNICYVNTGKKPIFSSDPVAKPICYPGTFIKTKTGYTCLTKYNDYKNPE